jgi:hypothetical protein
LIIIEDETKYKSWTSWDNKFHTLKGFYGPFENHICGARFEVVVNSDEERYNKIADNFQICKIGSFVHVIMVNPLHVSLSQLAIACISTCNCFNVSWI